jgi:gluconolactonase
MNWGRREYRRGKIVSVFAHGGGAASLALGLFFAPALAQTASGIPGVVAAGVAPTLVKEGFENTEGPLGAADGSLYFSDTNANRTYHLGLDGAFSVVREDTHRANGIALTREGDMIWADGDAHRLSKKAHDGAVATLTEGFGGKPFIQPNDLIVDAKGGVYFTDPGPRPVVPGRPTYVFYLPPGAHEPMVLDNANPRPNGITLTRDGKILIVDDTLHTTVYAFDVAADGSVRNKRPYAQLHDIMPGEESVADGMALDRDGRLYVATVRGIQVFDADARYLGTIAVPRQPSNMAFAGPGKRTLYITARQGLYRLNMLAQGPDRLGK